MMFSTRQAIVCMLMVTGVALCVHAQSTPPKEATASISGKVTFQSKGVKGVIVALRSMESTSFRKLTNYRGVTDAKGEYRILNVPAGTYSVTPTATAFVVDGQANGERNLFVNGSETIEDFDFSLIRGGVITGRVIDSEGQPVIEEEVYVFSPSSPGLGSVRPAAMTDDRGIYRAFGLKPGRYVVAAARDDASRSTGRPRSALYSRTYYPGVTDVAQATVIEVSDGSEAMNVDVTFSRTLTTYTASGRIVNGETGQPVPKVRYGVTHFVSPTQSNSVRGRDITNSRGEFKLENLVPGQYALTIDAQADRDWRAEEVRFEIVDQDVSGLVVRTVKGASVSGVVVLDGSADNAIREQLRKASLVIFVATDRTRQAGTLGLSTALRPDGSFYFGGLETGTATFSFSSSRRFRIIRVERAGIIQPARVELKQGEDVTLRIVVAYGDASIRGIVEIENGTIPPKGQLFLRAKKLDDTIYFAGRVDDRGQYLFENLIPGTYELSAGVFVPGGREPVAYKKQVVVVTAGSTTNAIIKLDLNSPQPKQ